MEKTERYRHELKYEITYARCLILRSCLQQVMKRDPYAKEDGTYRVFSIYFDNIYDKALREKIYGVNRREKFRIRYYNEDFSYITLEKKAKYNHLCIKYDAPLSVEECKRLLSDDTVWMRTHEHALVRELYAKMNSELLKPRILVSYRREPYIYSAGNVRVTFYYDIRTSLYRQQLLKPGAYDICAADNRMILEVKYDEFLPEILSGLLEIGAVRQQSFSKYGICRRFG